MSIEAKHIVRIINACKKSGVLELKLGSLEIKFGPGDAVRTSVVTGDAGPTPTNEELEEMQESARVEATLEQADEELAHMQVEDPALFEELLVNRELEHSEDGRREVFD